MSIPLKLLTLNRKKYKYFLREKNEFVFHFFNKHLSFISLPLLF